jgi:putative ABC transport system permease protein
MNITEAIKIAFLSLWANKLRSALTLLGVVIGVAAVIAVVTFVNGINGYVATKIFNLGADVFIVFKNSTVATNIDKFIEGEKRKDLTMEDYEAVLEACKHCEWVGAALRNDSGHVKYGEQSINDTTVRGMTPSMVPILDIDLTAGRMINDIDLRNNSGGSTTLGNNVQVTGTGFVNFNAIGSAPANAVTTMGKLTIGSQEVGVYSASGTLACVVA